MQITIINDCCDENAKLRQVSRAASLIKNSSAACFGVKTESEAAGFLVDAIDAFGGREGIVMANVAPRHGKGKKWENGTPFGFFWHKKTLIVSTCDGYILSLAKKLDILEEFRIVDIAEVLRIINEEELDNDTKNRIVKSQFRSFDFLPRLAAWIIEGKKLPAKKYELFEIPDMPKEVWFIDNFGNTKTTLLREDLPAGKSIELKIGGKAHVFSFSDRLKDLENETLGLVVGSSGIGNKRFLEIIFRGGNAAEKLSLKSESLIEI